MEAWINMTAIDAVLHAVRKEDRVGVEGLFLLLLRRCNPGKPTPIPYDEEELSARLGLPIPRLKRYVSLLMSLELVRKYRETLHVVAPRTFIGPGSDLAPHVMIALTCVMMGMEDSGATYSWAGRLVNTYGYRPARFVVDRLYESEFSPFDRKMDDKAFRAYISAAVRNTRDRLEVKNDHRANARAYQRYTKPGR